MERTPVESNIPESGQEINRGNSRAESVVIPIPVSLLLNFLGQNALQQQIRDEEDHPDFIQTRRFLGSAVSFEI